MESRRQCCFHGRVDPPPTPLRGATQRRRRVHGGNHPISLDPNLAYCWRMRQVTDQSSHPSDRSLSIRRLIVASSVVIVALAGCGDESSTDGASTPTTAQEPSATSGQAGTTGSLSEPESPETASAPSEPASADTTAAASEPASPDTTAADGTTSVADSSAPAEPGDACRLLTAAEAEAVLGMPVMDAVTLAYDSPGYGSGFDCSYSTVDQTAGPTTVHVGVLGTGFPRALWEAAQREEDVTEVDGVGEIAFFNRYKGSMDVFIDGVWLQAQVINIDEATVLTELTGICSRAIDRI